MSPASVSRILVIHPGALGDLLLARPALWQLKRTFPRAELTLAGAPRILSLFEATPFADRTIPLDRMGLHHCFADSPLPPEQARRLAAYDLIVSWFGGDDPHYRSHLENLGARVVIARPLPASGAGIHASRWLLETLEPLGIAPSVDSTPLLPVSEATRLEARAWATSQDLLLDGLVLVHPGSGAQRKCWPPNRFAAVIEWLRSAREAPVALVEGPADGASVAAVRRRIREPLPVARGFPLPLQAGLMAEAALFIGNDSGLTHLAAAVGVPTVALFGPTDPRVWAPREPHVRVLAGAGGTDPWQGLTVDRVGEVMNSPGSLAPSPPSARLDQDVDQGREPVLLDDAEGALEGRL